MRKKTLYKSNIVYDENKNKLILKYYILEREYNKETKTCEWGIEVETGFKGETSRERVTYLSEDLRSVTEIIDILLKNRVTAINFYEILDEIIQKDCRYI